MKARFNKVCDCVEDDGAPVIPTQTMKQHEPDQLTDDFDGTAVMEFMIECRKCLMRYEEVEA